MTWNSGPCLPTPTGAQIVVTDAYPEHAIYISDDEVRADEADIERGGERETTNRAGRESGVSLRGEGPVRAEHLGAPRRAAVLRRLSDQPWAGVDACSARGTSEDRPPPAAPGVTPL